MKKLTFIILITFFSFVLNNSAFAQENEPAYDYQEVYKGDTVPFDGYLFSNDGISSVIAKMESKIKLSQIEHEEELRKTKNNLQKIIEGRDIVINANKTMYDMQLQAKQAAVDSLVQNEKISNVKIAGGILLGVAVGTLFGFILCKL